MHHSKKNDFTTVADSAAGYFPLSLLVFSCCAAYQLQSTTESPPLQGFQQNLDTVFLFHSTLCLVLLRLHCVPDILTTFHPGSSNCSFAYKFVRWSFYPQLFFHKRPLSRFFQNANACIFNIIIRKVKKKNI